MSSFFDFFGFHEKKPVSKPVNKMEPVQKSYRHFAQGTTHCEYCGAKLDDKVFMTLKCIYTDEITGYVSIDESIDLICWDCYQWVDKMEKEVDNFTLVHLCIEKRKAQEAKNK